jgi:hypothetical protein
MRDIGMRKSLVAVGTLKSFYISRDGTGRRVIDLPWIARRGLYLDP